MLLSTPPVRPALREPQLSGDTCDSTPKPTEVSILSVPGNAVWAIARVKTREERAADAMFRERADWRRMAVWTYLPIVRTVQRRVSTSADGEQRVKTEKVERPKFPGFMFVAWADPCEVGNMLETPRFRGGLIRVGDQARLVSQLHNLQLALAVSKELKSVDWIQRGRRAKVASGPFMGIVGEVHERRGARVFLVGVDTLGGAELQVADHELEPVDGDDWRTSYPNRDPFQNM
jgi:transcription antitermination factor NusG